VLELQPILEQHPVDESTGRDGEAALVEGHERHHEPLGARHGLVDGDLPLDGSTERRKLSHLDKMEELLAGNVGVRLVRHHSSGVLGGLEAQGAVALRMRKNSERRGQAREEEEDGKAKSRTSAQRVVLKGQTRALTFDTGPAVSAVLSPTRARAPVKQPPARVTPRCPRNMDLQRLRTVMMERSRPSRRSRSPHP
jgi:hypothetical protein